MQTPERKREYQRAWIAERRQKAIGYLGGICVVCGTEENLDFDHIDPATKLFGISAKPSVNEEAFWIEVNKCQLLCRPHHICDLHRET